MNPGKKTGSLESRGLRIGVVSYLNAAPLWYALEQDENVRLFPDTPAALCELMRHGEIDVGLLPVVEALREPELSFFPDLGVAADGVVDSVGLFVREDLPAIRSVAVTSASRTSAALARIILHAADASPEYREAEVSPESLAERPEDAVLLIGDACLRARRFETDRVFVDLAAEWKLLTGLPVVFALWAGPKDNLTPVLHKRLHATLREGRDSCFDLVRYAAMETGWSEPDLAEYLTRTIRHELDDEARKGLVEFSRRAVELELLPRSAIDKALGAI